MIKRIEKEVKMKGKRENKFSTFSDLGNRKKGQAAMEFLMTYGWAILAAIIVIAVIGGDSGPKKVGEESGSATNPIPERDRVRIFPERLHCQDPS